MALLDGKRMVGRLELDPRALSVVPQMHHRLQVDRVRIWREPRVEPSEVRAQVRAVGLAERADPLLEVLPTQAHPDAPDEWVLMPGDWQLDAAADEEVLVVDGRMGRRGAPGWTASPVEGVEAAWWRDSMMS